MLLYKHIFFTKTHEMIPAASSLPTYTATSDTINEILGTIIDKFQGVNYIMKRVIYDADPAKSERIYHEHIKASPYQTADSSALIVNTKVVMSQASLPP